MLDYIMKGRTSTMAPLPSLATAQVDTASLAVPAPSIIPGSLRPLPTSSNLAAIPASSSSNASSATASAPTLFSRTSAIAATDPAADGDDDEDLPEEEGVYDLTSVTYRVGTSENDQLALVLNAASGQCKEKYRTQLWTLFFCYMCSIICCTITTHDPKGKESDLCVKAYAMYLGLEKDGYMSILKSGHGLFAGVEQKMPEYVLIQSKNFITSRTKGKGTHEVEKGKVIWATYKKVKTYVLNVANILCRDIRSGENKTGVLLEIREKLWIMDFIRKRSLRLSREAGSKCGKGMAYIHAIFFYFFYLCKLTFTYRQDLPMKMPGENILHSNA